MGGLSVLRRLTQTIGGGQFVYLGDTARLPYGNRSRQEISAFVAEIIAFLSDYQLDAVIMACNTSAALAQDVALKVANDYRVQGRGFEVFNLIEPTAQAICQQGYERVGVMATRATAESHAFGRALEALNFAGQVVEVGCPKLVPLIESGRLGEATIEAELFLALQEYLLALAGCDAIVLGCTHFPFVAERIQVMIKGTLKEHFSRPVVLIDPAESLAMMLRAEAPDMVSPPQAADMQFFTSGDVLEFQRAAERCLGNAVGPVKSVDWLAFSQIPRALVSP